MKKCFGCSFLAVLIGSYLSSNHQVASAVMFIGTEVILKLDYLRISYRTFNYVFNWQFDNYIKFFRSA